MTELERHRQFVAAWVDRTSSGAGSERLLQLLGQAVAAVWARAQQTLGDVTLQAVAERVAHHTRTRFSSVLTVVVGAEGVTFGPPPDATRAGEEQLRAATRFVLVELLTVLGNLTAGVLTPHLHAELERVADDAVVVNDAAGVPAVVHRPRSEEGAQ